MKRRNWQGQGLVEDEEQGSYGSRKLSEKLW
jgi:hypothetical protein